MLPISLPPSSTEQPIKSLTYVQPACSCERWLRGTCNSHPTSVSASEIESTPANFSTSKPLCGHNSSTSSSRRGLESRGSASSFIPMTKRSGMSLRVSLATSPRRPCVFTTRASVMNSPVVSRSRMVRSLPRRSVREGKVKFPRGLRPGFSLPRQWRGENRALSKQDLIDNVQRVALSCANTSSAQERAQRADVASLSADDFAYITLGHFQFDHAVIEMIHKNLVWSIDHPFRNFLDERTNVWTGFWHGI